MNLSTNAISKLINNLPKNFFKNISSNDQLIKKIYDYLLEQKVKESHQNCRFIDARLIDTKYTQKN